MLHYVSYVILFVCLAAHQLFMGHLMLKFFLGALVNSLQICIAASFLLPILLISFLL